MIAKNITTMVEKTDSSNKIKKASSKRTFIEYPYKGAISRAKIRKAVSEVIAERVNK